MTPKEMINFHNNIIRFAYRIARGHTDKEDRPVDGFKLHGASQMYWKGRNDAAKEILELLRTE
jgi:hypothetical protein